MAMPGDSCAFEFNSTATTVSLIGFLCAAACPFGFPPPPLSTTAIQVCAPRMEGSFQSYVQPANDITLWSETRVFFAFFYSGGANESVQGLAKKSGGSGLPAKPKSKKLLPLRFYFFGNTSG
jgi:hypothetical protein